MYVCYRLKMLQQTVVVVQIAALTDREWRQGCFNRTIIEIENAERETAWMNTIRRRETKNGYYQDLHILAANTTLKPS